MTYRELLDRLEGLSDDELDSDVTVYDYEMDEYFPSTDLTFSVDDVLDDGHPILLIKESM
jgi:hypothetical protein